MNKKPKAKKMNKKAKKMNKIIFKVFVLFHHKQPKKKAQILALPFQALRGLAKNLKLETIF